MKFIIIAFLLMLPVLGFAQFNDSVHYHTKIASTGTVNNTESSSSYVFDNNVLFGIKKKTFSLNSTNDWIYGTQQNILTNNDFNSTLDFDYLNNHRFYYWGLGNYTTSYSLKINNQYQAGVGVAYKVIDKKNATLNISDGILYEGSDIILPDSTRDIYNTFRNSARLSFSWNIGTLFSINGMGYYQNSLSIKSDYIVRTNLGASVKLYKWLTFTTNFTYNRFNRTEKENTLFTYGLVAERFY
jgi:hypothetical protein